MRSFPRAALALAALVVASALAPASGALFPASNDMMTGGDASDATTSPTVLRVGVGSSRFGVRAGVGDLGGPGDPRDAFGVSALTGDKLVVQATPQDSDGLFGITLNLYRPGGVGRVGESALPLVAPERIELNLDASGLWVFSIEPTAQGNYTLTVSLTPTFVNPPDPAGEGCDDTGSPRLAPHVPVRNSFVAQEDSHWYRFSAAIGDVVVARLTLRDPDGHDVDVFLRDPLCRIVATGQLGKPLFYPGLGLKGVSDVALTGAAPMTGEYRVEVHRASGVGAYLLDARAGPIFPTLPGNDATTGRDASDNTDAPTALPGGQGLFEGRFEDGDVRDSYSFTVAMGERALVSFTPSPASTGSMAISSTAGGGRVMMQEDAQGRIVAVLEEPAIIAAKYTIILVPLTGGGNYLLAVAKG